MNATHPKSKVPPLPIEDDERHGAQTDAFIARNRDALNESLRRSRHKVAKGEVSTKDIGTIIAEGRARHGKNP